MSQFQSIFNSPGSEGLVAHLAHQQQYQPRKNNPSATNKKNYCCQGYNWPYQNNNKFFNQAINESLYQPTPNIKRCLSHSLNFGPFFDKEKNKLKPYVDIRNLIGRPKTSDLEILGLLGQGSFSVVYKVRFKKSLFQEEENMPFALKILKKCEMASFSTNSENSEFSEFGVSRQKSDPREIDMELHCLEKIPEHPNLAKSIFAFQDEYRVYIGLELKEKNLSDFAEEVRHDDSISNGQLYLFLASIFKQIFRGVDHLHQNNVAHLDIKPENILLDFEKFQAQVSDFGLARFPEMEPFSGKIGTEGYMAVEIENGSAKSYTFSADVYSLGKTVEKVFCLAFGVEDTGTGLRDLIGDIAYRRLNDLLLDATSTLPQHRLSVGELLKKPFFQI